MKKNVLYKSVGLYSKEDIEEIKKDFECRDICNGEYNDVDFNDLADYNDIEWHYSFGDGAEWKGSWVDNIPVVIIGNLGLWNGPHKVIPTKCKSIIEAIYRCIKEMDEVEIYEDAYGNLKVDAYHHDGTNHFTIKKFENNKQRCLHFSKLLDEYYKA